MKKSFTLIELLIVVSMIGILTTVIIVASMSALTHGRDATRISDLNTVAVALQAYYSDNHVYPLVTTGDAYERYTTVTNTLITQHYLGKALIDPYDGEPSPDTVKNPHKFGYRYTCGSSGSTCTSYLLRAALETEMNNAAQCIGGGTQTDPLGSFEYHLKDGETETAVECNTNW